ncbi:phage holin [Gracilibacillus sp. HCP3S3_G5_1]|uniref:phage holin n=1 Tax=unclassified Gracilibacillus TaxID=2625209 RepID=UPI003F89E3CE
MLKEKLSKINNKWVRLVAWILVSINSSALIMGYELLPFDNEQIVSGVSIVFMFAIEAWNHWKDNDWSEKAKERKANK